MELQFAIAIASIAGFVVIIWATLVVVSHLSYRETLTVQRRYSEFQHGLRYTRFDAATAIAGVRRNKIEEFLGEFERFRDLPLEFLEMPPGVSSTYRDEFFGRDATATWHKARLRNELTEDRYLLAGRVIDAIRCLLRNELLSKFELPSLIRLEPLDVFNKHPLLFPWRVVIETSAENPLRELLQPLQEWLGIGVDFAKPVPITQFGRCMGDDTTEGVVGGTLMVDQGEFYVTCLHVLSDECGSRVWPPSAPFPTPYTQSNLDAALIELAGPCSINREQKRTYDVTSMVPNSISFAQRRSIKFKKTSCKSSSRARIQCADVRGFFLEGREYIGPHVLVVPDFTRWLWVYWPLLSRQFSEKGESGTWLVADGSPDWLGMIVGGAKPPSSGTLILPGHFLLDAVGASMNSGVWPRAKACE